MAKMLMGSPHFVRCIRPNDLKNPGEFNPEMVKEQLRYTGVLETTRIRKEVKKIIIIIELYNDDIIFGWGYDNYNNTQYPTHLHIYQ